MLFELRSAKLRHIERNCKGSVEKLWEREVGRLKGVENRGHLPCEAKMSLAGWKGLTCEELPRSSIFFEGASPRSGRNSLAQREALGRTPSKTGAP